MSDLLETAASIVELLQSFGVEVALVGGLAVSARSEPRFTRDVDIVVSVDDDDQAEELLRRLRRAGFVAADLVEQTATNRLATARCVKTTEATNIVVDLLFASSGMEQEIARQAEPLELSAGVVVPVASAPYLVAMKVLSRGPKRLQDDIDIQNLVADFDAESRAEVKRILRRIEERGYSRGKALVEEFQSLLDEMDSSNG